MKRARAEANALRKFSNDLADAFDREKITESAYVLECAANALEQAPAGRVKTSRVNLKQDLVQEAVFIWKQWNADAKTHGGNINLLMTRVYDLFEEEWRKEFAPTLQDTGVTERSFDDWFASLTRARQAGCFDHSYYMRMAWNAALAAMRRLTHPSNTQTENEIASTPGGIR